MSIGHGTLPSTRVDGTPYPVVRTDEEWRARLTPFEYRVLREAGTEPAWSGDYNGEKRAGRYACRGCDTYLFTSSEKFDSQCGWPSFWSPLDASAVVEIEDRSLGMRRVEVRCATCGSHLGHVFSGEGFKTPTNLRYCINSVCLTLIEE